MIYVEIRLNFSFFLIFCHNNYAKGHIDFGLKVNYSSVYVYLRFIYCVDHKR